MRSTPGLINLENPVEFTIRQFAELVIDITGSRSKLVYLPLPQDDPRQRQPGIGQAKSRLWQPAVALPDGLGETVHYFDHLPSEGSRADGGRR